MSERHVPLSHPAFKRPGGSVHRSYYEQVIGTLEALMKRLDGKPLPLDLLERYERALTVAHVGNLLTLEQYPESIREQYR